VELTILVRKLTCCDKADTALARSLNCSLDRTSTLCGLDTSKIRTARAARSSNEDGGNVRREFLQPKLLSRVFAYAGWHTVAHVAKQLRLSAIVLTSRLDDFTE